MEDKYCTIQGLKIRYWEKGTGDPVLLLHGFGSFIETWEETIELLSHHHRVIAPDLPSSGKSDKKFAEIKNFYLFNAGFIEAFLKEMHIEKTSIVGHSAGAGVGIIFASHYPEHTNKLVLISSSGLGRKVTWAYRLMSVPFIAHSSYKFLSKRLKLIAWFILRSPSKAARRIINKVNEIYQTEESKRIIIRILQNEVSLLGQKNIIPKKILKKVKATTLIIWGKNDPFVPFNHALKATKYIPNAHLVAINSHTHALHIDDPKKINKIIDDFLQ